MSEIVIYTSPEGEIELQVSVDKDTIWLSQKQMSKLFNKNVRTVSEHIKNMFTEGELEEKSVVREFRITANDGKSYLVAHYNLDVIISVGYRVRSKEGTKFRIWATNVLRKYLLEGYALNKHQLLNQGVDDLRESLFLLEKVLMQQGCLDDLSKEALIIISQYAKSWCLLLAYDEETLELPSSKHNVESRAFEYKSALDVISSLKSKLIEKNQASNIFGVERDKSLQSILNNIEQTFAGEELYASIEEKAAHLLYFIIKDHPFTDGNKRIGSLLFLIYMHLQNMQITINESGMVALALLIAESESKQKDLIIRLIVNLISNGLG